MNLLKTVCLGLGVIDAELFVGDHQAFRIHAREEGGMRHRRESDFVRSQVLYGFRSDW